jgi:diguanylate cyclase (GGDEF)-like protein/PAS domain S-box-containing protein
MQDARVRAGKRADRRELLTEGIAALAFVAVASAMAASLPHGPLPIVSAAWLLGLCFVLQQVEFDVGEGRTRPVQLALIPMLLMLPPPLVPLLVVTSHLLARLPAIAAGRGAADTLVASVADAWYCVTPALVLALIGLPSDALAASGVLALALTAQIGTDFTVAAARLRIGLGLDVREQLKGFAWVYLVDVLLTPVALLAAAEGLHAPWRVAAVVPLALLLTVFARERRGRIDNALELHALVQESEQRLQSIVQNSSDLIAILDADGAIRTLTGSVDAVFGPAWRTAIGTHLVDRVHPDDAALLAAFLARIASGELGASQSAEWRLLRHGGAYGYVETVATNLLGDPRVQGIVVTARDVQDRRAFEEQLRHRAFHDPLTQLANRALFYDRIEHALSRQARDDQRVSVLFIDLDDFKLINDELGHGVGDELLVGVARRLRGCLRSADTAARLGGDEFGVLLEAVAGPNEPVQTADRIMAAFAEPFSVHGEPVPVDLSIGITVSDPGNPHVDELLRQADLAMYAAKRHGKRRAQLYDIELERVGRPTAGEEPERATWFQRGAEQREEILALLRRPEAVTAVFQPILDLRTGLVSGYEALARFVTPEQRPPNAWFAQAHRCGLGYDLEAMALATALSAAGRPEGTYLTLNVSPSALASQPVQAVLPARLDGLVIEITENELLTDDPGFEAALADVRARGGLIAVDDAGAGYAGLKHVMRLMPDLIKLDRSLVAGVTEDPSRAALISSFVRFARDSDAAVCAEGIETLSDLARLADLDVTFGQGFVIARPALPWPVPAPAAAQTCAVSFTASLAGEQDGATGDLREQSLERIIARLSRAVDEAGLAAAADSIRSELRADRVLILRRPAGTDDLHPVGADAAGPRLAIPGPDALLRERRLRQILAGDPAADPLEVAALSALGYRSLLRLPVVCEDRVVGALEAYSVGDRPWSRFEIRRARMIAHQLGAALERIERHAERLYS